MWISEWFVQHDERSESDQLDLEEIGELVARNLLEPEDSNESSIWKYTLHDVVHLFAQFRAKEEAFVVRKDKADTRNLLPENNFFCPLYIFFKTRVEHPREATNIEDISCNINPGGSVANFASLRVLDISSKESDWLVDSLCELRHLRYLSISNTNISRLPGDIHKMWFLQHIQLESCRNLDKLPNSITKLACLRYLNLEGSNVDVLRRGFGGLTNLTTIYLDNLGLLKYVENFHSVVELNVYYCPELKRISGLAKLWTADVCYCPKLKLLEGIPVLDSMELDWEP